MTTIRLRYIKAYTDRHGKKRHYYRRPGLPQAPLPGEAGSREFMEAYHAARERVPTRQIGQERTEPGTFNALIVLYYSSSDYNTSPRSG